MTNKQLNLSEILEGLFQHCSANDTGTFFISTNENRSCQVVINQGEITAMSLGIAKGLDALTLLMETQSGSFSFKSVVLPMTDDAKIASSEDVLQQLGYEKPKITQPVVQAEPGAVVSKPVRTYRGQVIQDTSAPTEKPPAVAVDVAKEVKSEKEEAAAKKPVRMYRGQVVK